MSAVAFAVVGADPGASAALERLDQAVKQRHGGDARGSAETRRRRKQWLVETFRANVDVIAIGWADGDTQLVYPTDRAMFEQWATVQLDALTIDVEFIPACRCYRCGRLLTVDDVTVDRIIPGAEGGTYRRTNIRPACGFDNSSTGGVLGAARRRST